MCRVAAELLKLRNQREKLADENKKYIDSHPELHRLVDQFVCACISSKPTDIVKFGAFFFSDMRKHGGIGPCPIVFAGPSGMSRVHFIPFVIFRHFGWIKSKHSYPKRT